MINILSAQEQIRTATPVKAPPPQSGASTNFATWALFFQSFKIQIALVLLD
jgi:hypothetical protein